MIAYEQQRLDRDKNAPQTAGRFSLGTGTHYCIIASTPAEPSTMASLLDEFSIMPAELSSIMAGVLVSESCIIAEESTGASGVTLAACLEQAAREMAAMAAKKASFFIENDEKIKKVSAAIVRESHSPRQVRVFWMVSARMRYAMTCLCAEASQQRLHSCLPSP